MKEKKTNVTNTHSSKLTRKTSLISKAVFLFQVTIPRVYFTSCILMLFKDFGSNESLCCIAMEYGMKAAMNSKFRKCTCSIRLVRALEGL